MSLSLSAMDHTMLEGRQGEACRVAMDMVVRTAQTLGARRLVDVHRAHLVSVYYAGPVSLLYAERMAALGAQVAIPSTTNTGCVDLLHQGLFEHVDPRVVEYSRRMAEIFTAMGAEPTMTCAPYHLPEPPAFGECVVWGESNAIAYCNSVLGARTEKCQMFLDVAGAVTGRMPCAGLYETENRAARILFRLVDLPEQMLESDLFYQVLGYLVGREAGATIAAVQGLPQTATCDQLRGLGAANAAAGDGPMFHAIGLTPEAPTLEAAFQAREPERTVDIRLPDVLAARRELDSGGDVPLSVVALGTPHFSLAEFEKLVALLDSQKVSKEIDLFVTTSRHVLAQITARGGTERLQAAGVQLVVDLCSYYGPLLRGRTGSVMTNAAKYAYYAPASIGMPVRFGTLQDCVASAVLGRVTQVETDPVWGTS